MVVKLMLKASQAPDQNSQYGCRYDHFFARRVFSLARNEI